MAERPNKENGPGGGTPPLNHEHERLIRFFRDVRFRKKTLGGVDEQDVWKKLGELNELYEASLSAERARYDALLAEQRRSSDELRRKYNALVRRLQSQQTSAEPQRKSAEDSHAPDA